MRLVGRFFKGVVASGSLPPDAAQDVVRVNADRRRVFVADGAGDTGSSAGDWANVLGLCFSASREAASTRDPEWLRRAVDTWSRSSHVRQLAAAGEVLNKGEARLLKEGVESSFLAATFSYERELALQWTAAGDCEVMLFRGGRLLRWGPVPTWRDFSSFPGGVSSKGDAGSAFHYDDWPLELGDVILFATDALACHVLRECETAGDIPESVGRLLSLGDWNAMRVWIETARGPEAGNLENDDVGMIRIRVEQDSYASGSFALTNDVSARQAALTRDLRLLGPSRNDPPLVAAPPRPTVHPFTDESVPVVDSAGEQRDVADSSAVEASTGGRSQREMPSVDAPGEALSSSGPAQVEQVWRAAPPAPRPLRPQAETAPPFSWTTFIAGVVAGIVLIAVLRSVTDMIHRDRGQRQITPVVANATLTPVARGSSATPPPLADAPALVAAAPADVPPKPAASLHDPEPKNDRPRSAGKPKGAAAAPPPPTTARASVQPAPTGTTAPTGTAPTGTIAPTTTSAPTATAATTAAEQPPASPSSSSSPPSEPEHEPPTPSAVPAAAAEVPTTSPCSLAKKTSLFAADDERRKVPLLVVAAAVLPCTRAADAGGQIVLFRAWLSLPGTFDPLTLAWVRDRRLPDAMNVWLAPEGEYLGNLKAGTRFTLGEFVQREDKVWIELRVNAVR